MKTYPRSQTPCERLPDGTLRRIPDIEWFALRWAEVTTHNDPPTVSVWMRLDDQNSHPAR